MSARKWRMEMKKQRLERKLELCVRERSAVVCLLEDAIGSLINVFL